MLANALTVPSQQHIFSQLSQDNVFDICKFLSASDVVFNVRSVCRATYQCINIDDYQGGEADDRYIRLIGSNLEGYDECLGRHLNFGRLLNEREVRIISGNVDSSNIDKSGRAKIKLRMSLRFKYIEMTFKPYEDGHFMIRVTKSTLLGLDSSQKDPDLVVEQFKEILRKFKEVTFYQSLFSKLEHEDDYIVLVGVFNGGKPFINELYSFGCTLRQKESLRLSFEGRLLSLASQRTSKYLKFHSDYRKFLEIIDSIFCLNYLDEMSSHTIIMISQQEFIIPNRQLVVDLNSTFDYGIDDRQINKVRDVPCTLHCHVNPLNRELIYQPSVFGENISMNLTRIGLFCGIGIYLGALQYFTRIPSFRFTRDLYFSKDSDQIMSYVFIAIDLLFGFSTSMYFTGTEFILEERELKKLAYYSYMAKLIICGIEYNNPLKMLKLLHLPPLEIAHNVVSFGTFAALGITLYNEFNSLVTATVSSFSYWKSKYFNKKE